MLSFFKDQTLSAVGLNSVVTMQQLKSAKVPVINGKST